MQTPENTPDQSGRQAKQAQAHVADQIEDAAKDAKSTTNDAVATGKAYVQDALKAAGKQFDTVKSQAMQTTDYLAKAINDEPVKAVVVTAIVSSALTALLLSALRDRDPY